MNNYSGTLFKSRRELLEDLDAVLVRPIMENGTEVVHICRDRLGCEEVAASVVSMRLTTGCQSYCAMNVTLSFRSAGSRETPSVTVSGRS